MSLYYITHTPYIDHTSDVRPSEDLGNRCTILQHISVRPKGPRKSDDLLQQLLDLVIVGVILLVGNLQVGKFLHSSHCDVQCLTLYVSKV